MSPQNRPHAWLAAGLAAVVATAAGGVVGRADGSATDDTFVGACRLQGTVTFNPPLTTAERTTAVTYQATGTCRGALGDRRVVDAPVVLHHSGRAAASCLAARTLAPGRGAITFPDGATIPYAFTFRDVLTETHFRITGGRSGSARAHGSFLTSRTSPAVAAKCGGAGNVQAPMDMTLRTTPSIG